MAKLDVNHNDLEIVIEDNSENNEEFQTFFETTDQTNIKYFYSKEWRSVSDNSNQAILHSTGKYVSFIGDDDAVGRQIVDVARLMEEYQIDSCGCDYTLYRWPEALLHDKNSFEYHSKGAFVRWPQIDKELDDMLRNGIQSKKNIPGVYHGIVSRNILNHVYEKTGTFFPGPSPDMANSVAVSLYVKRHMITSIPFLIDGYSKSSTGHLTEKKAHIGKLEEQSFLPKNVLRNWTEEIPKIWLPNTIWPESAIQAFSKCGRQDLTEKFNYTAMYIKISILYPQCKGLCREYLKKYSTIKNIIATYIQITITYLKNRIKDSGSRAAQEAIHVKEPISIEKAIKKSEEIIDSRRQILRLKKLLDEKFYKAETK